jgi:sulfite reductase (NADPH) hemoprotein beta-component
MAELSPIERIKAASHGLRGTIVESLADPITGALREDDAQLLKVHGSYQQDDRDVREERRLQKLEPAYSFMIRARLPGGVCTPQQWLALDAIARRYANSTLRLTTRQSFQLHGVVKRELKATIAAINQALIDTIAACGDVNRNVMASVLVVESSAHAEVLQWARRLSEHLLPRSRAYHEIWLDGVRLADTPGKAPEEEPILGRTYLPRKFKCGIAIPPSNDVDVFSQDLGFIALIEADTLVGFNVCVGGGLGTTHGEPATYPRLADVIGFVTPQQLLAVAAAVVTTQRDFGDRSDRKHARLKYTIDERGLDWFVAEVQSRAGFALAPQRPFKFLTSGDQFGWRTSADGLAHLLLRIPSGRIADREGAPWLSGLRAIASVHSGEFRITPNQNLLISGVASGARARIDELVRQHGLDLYARAQPLRRDALACVALPTCPLAMAEAERYLPALLELIEARLAAHGLSQAPLLLRISGCPNGCSRPYLAEIGLVGKAPGRYNLHLGSDAQGQRLNVLYRENLDETAIVGVLDGLLAQYARERLGSERFGDYLWRARHLPVRAAA